MFLRSERQFQSLCAVCAMERKIGGGGGLGMSVPRKKFRGWSLSIKDLKFQELIILTDVGGGVVVV